LCYEEKAKEEIKLLKVEIKNLKDSNAKLSDELKDKNAIIDILRCENNTLSHYLNNSKMKTSKLTEVNDFNEFMTPKQ
jgi:FtsZ-binding cell division protein ZapB